MTDAAELLLVEDEPLILMDLEFAAEDRGHRFHSAHSVAGAMSILGNPDNSVDVAVLDVSLVDGETCLPIAQELQRRSIPFILHSGDLDRRDETIRSLNAILVPKPACSDKVIASAIAELENARQGRDEAPTR